MNPRTIARLILGSALVFALISTLTASGLGGYFRLTLWMSFMIMMAPAVRSAAIRVHYADVDLVLGLCARPFRCHEAASDDVGWPAGLNGWPG